MSPKRWSWETDPVGLILELCCEHAACSVKGSVKTVLSSLPQLFQTNSKRDPTLSIFLAWNHYQRVSKLNVMLNRRTNLSFEMLVCWLVGNLIYRKIRQNQEQEIKYFLTLLKSHCFLNI